MVWAGESMGRGCVTPLSPGKPSRDPSQQTQRAEIEAIGIMALTVKRL